MSEQINEQIQKLYPYIHNSEEISKDDAESLEFFLQLVQEELVNQQIYANIPFDKPKSRFTDINSAFEWELAEKVLSEIRNSDEKEALTTAVHIAKSFVTRPSSMTC